MFKSAIRALLRSAYSKPLPPVSNHEANLLSEMKQTFADLPSAPAHSAWERYMAALKEKMAADDPRMFLQWDVIEETMCVSYARFLLKELAYLRQDWQKWCPVLKESGVGRPVHYLFHPATSGNLIHHSYHIARFQAATSCNLDELDVVYEFGGGYGCACKVIHALGFKGQYIIQDLPPFLALQKYYLNMHGIKPTQTTRPIEPPKGRALFLAEWSLSESPLEARAAVLPIAKAFDYQLIGYQSIGADVDNVRYFSEWGATIPRRWKMEMLEHIPGGNAYLFGAP